MRVWAKEVASTPPSMILTTPFAAYQTRNMRYIGELTKFRACPPEVALGILKVGSQPQRQPWQASFFLILSALRAWSTRLHFAAL